MADPIKLPEVIVVIDRIESLDKDGNISFKLIDKSGESRSIGKKLNDRVEELQSNMPVRLQMASYNGHPYISDFQPVAQALADEFLKRNAPQKNLKDISIEAQVAVKAVADLLSSGKEVPQDIQDMTFEWIRKSLKGAIE